MITLPELPEGYRWKYYYSYMDSVSKLRLEKRILGFWIHKETTWVNTGLLFSEQEALDRASKRILDYLDRELKTKKMHYGVYEGGTNEH